jgi:hypothetical protein
MGWLACTEPWTQNNQNRGMGQESLGQVRDTWRPPSGVGVHVTDDVLSDIISTSVLILINTYYTAEPLTSKSESTGCIAQPRRSRMKPLTSSGDGCAKLIASWSSSL